jgi:L-threonylcarbamoyladenylate synthase
MWNDENLVRVLKNNGVVVMPTDTLYGIVGTAFNENTVEKIYEIRKRKPEKPCIVFIGSVNEIKKFGIELSEEQKNIFEKYTEPTSIILDCLSDEFEYLHRGTKTLAFRIPAPEELRNLLLTIGPLVAPSANTEGLPPAKNIQEAKEYFGDQVDLYVDGGEISSKASKVIRLNNDDSIEVLRP